MINIAVLKQSLTELKLIDRCDFVYNGQEAVNKARDILQSKYNSHKYWGGVKSI
jgi:CheY-like chemotaxis protein